MSTIVVYKSKYGSTKTYAEWIAKELSCEAVEAGHIKGAYNIPLSQLEERKGEIPKDVPVYLHCRSSQRSYYAICRLQSYGYTNVTNISGSFLGISLYEYFNDKKLGRTPIVTEYNFK